MLLSAGAVGTYLRYRGTYGRLGIVGSTITGIGFAAMAVGSALAIFLQSHNGAPVSLVGLLIVTLGSGLLGLAFLRGGIVRTPAILGITALTMLVANLVFTFAVPVVVAAEAAWAVYLIALPASWVFLGNEMRSIDDETFTSAEPAA